MSNKNKATIILEIENKNHEFSYDILKSTRGPDAVDIRSFYADSGLFTYDVGFTSTASCSSDITFIDGHKGELRYKGILIEELANK